MAVSGVVLFLFVLEHLAGNLLLYVGPSALDAYGALLKKAPALLWAARIGLIAFAALHVWSATALTLASRAARPEGYRETRRQEATYASLTMRWGGVLILLFLIFHLMDLTFGNANPAFEEGRVYHNVVATFSRPPVAIFYVVAMVALGFHLYHGLWSMLQTLGVSHPRYDAARKRLAALFAVVIVAGNVSFPLAVLTGFVKDVPPATAAARK